MVIGQVVGIHIDDQAIRAGRFDVTMTDPVTRLGYLDFGFSDGLHEMPRPEWTE
jgi:flavin reductase (DIM6/NTAB) family NADH-FMN oxidoreductase RutF